MGNETKTASGILQFWNNSGIWTHRNLHSTHIVSPISKAPFYPLWLTWHCNVTVQSPHPQHTSTLKYLAQLWELFQEMRVPHSCRYPLLNLAKISLPTSGFICPGLNQLRVAWVILFFPSAYGIPLSSYWITQKKRRPQLPRAAHTLDKKGKGWRGLSCKCRTERIWRLTDLLRVTQAVCGRGKN